MTPLNLWKDISWSKFSVAANAIKTGAETHTHFHGTQSIKSGGDYPVEVVLQLGRLGGAGGLYCCR